MQSKSHQIVFNYIRFETIVEPNFKIMKLYTECDDPNYYHYYFAEKLRQGRYGR